MNRNWGRRDEEASPRRNPGKSIGSARTVFGGFVVCHVWILMFFFLVEP
jgi:hypothetical protein